MRRAALILAFAATPAAALPPLGEQTAITEGVIATALAYEIGRVCGPIDAKRLQGIAYLLQLQSQARALGYGQAEIDAWTDNEAEKTRLEAVARDRLAAMGAVPGDEASHCAVGDAEIAAGTATGALLDRN